MHDHPLKTVAVKTDAKDNPDGFYLINEDDFDPKVHTKHDGKKPEPKAEKTEGDKKPEGAGAAEDAKS